MLTLFIRINTQWAKFFLIGNAVYTNKDKEKTKRAIYDYGAFSKKKGGEAVYEIITSDSFAQGGMLDGITVLLGPLSEKMKLFPRK